MEREVVSLYFKCSILKHMQCLSPEVRYNPDMEPGVIYIIVARDFKRSVLKRSRLISSVARPVIWLVFIFAA